MTKLNQSSVDNLPEWATFVFTPILLIAILIGLYFSGTISLQQLVAPTINGLSANSWREFGLLEQLQNVFLLAVIFILLFAARNVRNTMDKACFIVGALVFLFLFLEEIDYGIHFYDLYNGKSAAIEVKNWHNQEINGEQNVKAFKQIADLLMFAVFIVLPLIKNKIPIQFIKNVAPSRWFIIGFIASIALSEVAHLLQDQGRGIIDGVEGNLSGNISEFRELSNYYFYMLYAFQLLKLDSLFKKGD